VTGELALSTAYVTAAGEQLLQRITVERILGEHIALEVALPVREPRERRRRQRLR